MTRGCATLRIDVHNTLVSVQMQMAEREFLAFISAVRNCTVQSRPSLRQSTSSTSWN
jgi:predicted HAD superfamily phosphohydrolase YqeG